MTVAPQIPFPLPQVDGQYQMNIEVNSGLTQSTYELDQYYDGYLNQAVNILTEKGNQINVYTYDKTNEVILVSGDICVVQSANSSVTSPIPSVMINGTEHIISPINFILQLNQNSTVSF